MRNPLVLNGLSSRQMVGRIIFYVILVTSLITGALCVWNAMKWVDKPFAGFLVNRHMVVGYIGQYSWTGTQAGLKNPDKILKANNRDISSPKELDEIIKNTTAGDPVTYSVSKGGKIIEVTVPTMRFSITDLFMTFGIIFLLGILFLIIGVVVYILKPFTLVSWVFFLGCVLQSISFFMSFDMETTHTFIRPYLFIDAFLPAVVIHLSLLFPQKLKMVDKYPYMQAAPYVISSIMIIPVQIFYPGPLFSHIYTFVLFYAVISVLSLIASMLHAFFSKSSILARQRAKVVLFGSVLSLPIPAAAPFIASTGSTVGGINIITNFSSIPMVIFPASIAYAIAKHNLFDVDVYIKRTVGYVIMTVIVGVVYFSMQVIIRNMILTPMLGESADNIYPLLFAVLVVFFFNPVNQKVQGLVETLFYRKKFDYKDTVLSVSNALTSVLNIDEIMRRIIDTLRTEMFIDKAGVILLDPQKECRALFVTEHTDRQEDRVVEHCLPSDDPLIALVSTEKKLITKYDIAEAPRYSVVRESCGERFSDMQSSVVIPLIYKNNVTGILALGYKKSGHFYSREDIHLLETLANQGAVAIENAKMAEQMKREEIVRTNLSRYLSPQVVDSIVKENVRVNLGGDRKVVTVLFSDIRNFTSITESRPADQLVRILNEYFTEMANIIFANQGSLDKYIGDAIVAVFGSLIATENPAQNAVMAAVGMMRRMPQLNEKWLKEYGFSMNMGVGISTGEVFLGNIGSPERMEFTVIGDTVNVASRFSGLARPGQILVARETLKMLHPGVRYNELPQASVKGKAEKLEVFEILFSSDGR